MNDRLSVGRGWLWLTLPLALLVALASLGGLTNPGIYGTSVSWVAQGQAQDFADLVFALPVLIVAALLAARGSRGALLVWFGAVAYMVYSFVIYAFSVRYNAFFLVYVAALGCAAWAMIGGMMTTHWGDIASRFPARTPAKPVGGFIVGLAVLFYLLWLKEDVTALLTATTPASVAEAGILTNPVHILDMALLLPAMIYSGVLLWRKRPLGYGLAGVMLVITIFEALGIATIGVFSARAGIAGSEGPAVVLSVLALIGTGLLAWYLGSLRNAAAVGAQGRTA